MDRNVDSLADGEPKALVRVCNREANPVIRIPTPPIWQGHSGQLGYGKVK